MSIFTIIMLIVHVGHFFVTFGIAAHAEQVGRGEKYWWVLAILGLIPWLGLGALSLLLYEALSENTLAGKIEYKKEKKKDEEFETSFEYKLKKVIDDLIRAYFSKVDQHYSSFNSYEVTIDRLLTSATKGKTRDSNQYTKDLQETLKLIKDNYHMAKAVSVFENMIETLYQYIEILDEDYCQAKVVELLNSTVKEYKETIFALVEKNTKIQELKKECATNKKVELINVKSKEVINTLKSIREDLKTIE